MRIGHQFLSKKDILTFAFFLKKSKRYFCIKIWNMKLVLPLIIVGLSFVACKQDGEKTEKVEEIRTGGPISEIIRNPESAEGLKDTVNIAKFEWEDTFHDFGEVQEGKVVSYRFKFRNSGKVPLIIQDATSTCGCTAPSIPNYPIVPNDTGSILVVFNSLNKESKQSKPVTVLANTFPSKSELKIEAFVIKKKSK